ncbi:MAG: ABC transporter permease, partial [Rhodoferax sp.]|nr:ABC transporter permease [Rhodoferax sp.]
MPQPETRHPAALALALLAGLPLAASLGAALQAGIDRPGWTALWRDPQTLPALALSLGTGLLSTLLALLASSWLLGAWLDASPSRGLLRHLPRWLGPLLALPHVAFAIGLVALIAPAGWLLRLLSPWATGLDQPPPWPTTQDPWGLGLILVLCAKEIPFLLWAGVAHLSRADVAGRLRRELALAHTLGCPAATAWWRIGWPQVLPRLWTPLLAVLAYGLTVVDVALVIGPAAPPTLATLAWQWLQDPDPLRNAQGAAAGWLLAALLALCVLALRAALHPARWRGLWVRPRPLAMHRPTDEPGGNPRSALPGNPAGLLLGLLLGLYLAVALALAAGSLSGPWPFPDLLPQHLSTQAWQSVLGSGRTLWTTLGLALAAAACTGIWVVAWLELAPASWQATARPLLLLPLALPGVLWALGMHRLALQTELDAAVAGLWLAHALCCLPYVLMTLEGAYRAFDPRLAQVSATLGLARWTFLWRIKWPLLRAPLAAAGAVGAAVSVAQYLPTLYVGGGRFETVTTEAV